MNLFDKSKNTPFFSILILLVSIIIFPLYVNCQTSPIDKKNGFKNFKLNSDISLYKDVVTKNLYLSKYTKGSKISDLTRYNNIVNSQPMVRHHEYCTVWVYTGSDNYIGSSYINSIIISTYKNKIITIQVNASYTKEAEDAMFELYGKPKQDKSIGHELPPINGVEPLSCSVVKSYSWNGKICSIRMSTNVLNGKCKSDVNMKSTLQLTFYSEPLINTLMSDVNKSQSKRKKSVVNDL